MRFQSRSRLPGADHFTLSDSAICTSQQTLERIFPKPSIAGEPRQIARFDSSCEHIFASSLQVFRGTSDMDDDEVVPFRSSWPRPNLGLQREHPRTDRDRPTLSIEPTRLHLRNVQQAMARHTDQLCPVPSQEGPGRFPNPCRVGKPSEAHWTPLALVPQYPAQPKQADRKRRDNLEVFG
jgi:hypothetical protein